MEITIEQLESLLNEQKRLVAEKLINSSTEWNAENIPGRIESLRSKINENSFMQIAKNASIPNDVIVLKKYNIK